MANDKNLKLRRLTDAAAWKRAAIRTIQTIVFKNRIAERYFEGRFARFDMVFTDVWRSYLLEYKEQIGARLDLFCEGMDEISVGVIRSVAERYFYMAPACRFDNIVAYRPERIFTPYERALQIEFANIMKQQQGKYLFPEGSGGLSISVFASHNGLDFIPNGRQRLRGAIAIDGGAFIGDSALAIREYGLNAIYCFEPDRLNIVALKQTIKMNGLDNIFIEEAGLGGRQTKAVVSGNRSEASLKIDESSEGAVRVMTIDEFCVEKSVVPGLIKLDIEGMEYEAILGARKTIQAHKPILIISIYHNAKDFLEIRPMIQNMTADYTFLVRRLDPFHPTNETVLICF